MSDEHNPPAFPVANGRFIHNEGMTLRDYFAGQALIGMLAGHDVWLPHTNAKAAYDTADAMLKARKEPDQ